MDSHFLVTFFKQGLVDRGGNCATVALIKSAIGIFDRNVFSAQHFNDSYAIQLKNNKSYVLTDANLQTAKKMHGFVQLDNSDMGNDYFDYASLCYAVMGQVCYEERNYRQYWKALRDINHGENCDFIDRLLGLESIYTDCIERANDINGFIGLVGTKENYMIYSDGHAVYGSLGTVDLYGTPTAYQDAVNQGYDLKYIKYKK